MKLRGSNKAGSSRWSLGWKLGLPALFLLCSFFFLAGFFASNLLPQGGVPIVRPTPRLLEKVDESMEFDPLPHGQTGESSITSIPFQILSWKPRALYFPHFATVEQCQSMIKMAKAQLAPSTLALRKGETAENTKGIRTSSGMFISASEDKTGTLDHIEEKIARATMIPRSHGENLSPVTSKASQLRHPHIPSTNLFRERKNEEKQKGFVLLRSIEFNLVVEKAFNILRYEVGQRYNSHYDAFNPAEYGPQKSQRIASFLLYLSDVEEGGETMFPFENGLPIDLNYDFQKCVGFKIKPRTGDGLLFYSLFPNGTIDVTSLHGSCPVLAGKKWVATKWIRNQEQSD